MLATPSFAIAGSQIAGLSAYYPGDIAASDTIYLGYFTFVVTGSAPSLLGALTVEVVGIQSEMTPAVIASTEGCALPACTRDSALPPRALLLRQPLAPVPLQHLGVCWAPRSLTLAVRSARRLSLLHCCCLLQEVSFYGDGTLLQT